MPSLNKFLHPVTQNLVTIVHLRKSRLVLRKSGIQLVDGVRSTGTDGD